MVRFFSPEEESRLVAAIQAAERTTSGEIRVHVERETRRPAIEEGWRIFRRLGMHKTKDRNGVMILLDLHHQAFSIIGDEGIHKAVGQDFWTEERDLLQDHFRRGEFVEGLEIAIARVGEKLKGHFPYAGDDIDENELPDTISYG
ncbi:MAG: TPM domain-containing protein [Bacteroidota bacterium]